MDTMRAEFTNGADDREKFYDLFEKGSQGDTVPVNQVSAAVKAAYKTRYLNSFNTQATPRTHIHLHGYWGTATVSVPISTYSMPMPVHMHMHARARTPHS